MEEMINPLYLTFWQLKGFYSFNYASIESGILIRNVHSAGDSRIAIMVALHLSYNLNPFTWLSTLLLRFDPKTISLHIRRRRVLGHFLLPATEDPSKAGTGDNSHSHNSSHARCFSINFIKSIFIAILTTLVLFLLDHFFIWPIFLIWSNFLSIEMLKLPLCRMFASPVTLLVVVSREFPWFSCFFRIKSSISGVMIVFQEARS